MARLMMDLGVNATGDVVISAGGDFSIMESTAEHQKELLLNNKGDFKENPAMGIGVFWFIDDETFDGLVSEMSLQFQDDGMEIGSLNISLSGVINSDAYYV